MATSEAKEEAEEEEGEEGEEYDSNKVCWNDGSRLI